MIKRVLLPRWVLGKTVDGMSPLAEVIVSECETMDSDTNEAGSVFFFRLIFPPWTNVLCSESVEKVLRGNV